MVVFFCASMLIVDAIAETQAWQIFMMGEFLSLVPTTNIASLPQMHLSIFFILLLCLYAVNLYTQHKSHLPIIRGQFWSTT